MIDEGKFHEISHNCRLVVNYIGYCDPHSEGSAGRFSLVGLVAFNCRRCDSVYS